MTFAFIYTNHVYFAYITNIQVNKKEKTNN